MYRYICTKCGGRSYSATDLKHFREKGCAYCGGRIVQEEQTDTKRQRRRTPPDVFTVVVGIVAMLIFAIVVLAFSIAAAAAPEEDQANAVRTYEGDAVPELSMIVAMATGADPHQSPAVTASPEGSLDEEPEAVYPLTDDERALVESVTMAESGGEPYEGQVLVVQCIYNVCIKDGIRPAEAIRKYQYSTNRPEPTDSVKKAVAAVFDLGETVTDEPILYFYAPAWCTSKWHESQIFVLEYGGHRFFKEG
jgi:DNA-directed RNA polymerase subunit RPC12/RpoP